MKSEIEILSQRILLILKNQIYNRGLIVSSKLTELEFKEIWNNVYSKYKKEQKGSGVVEAWFSEKATPKNLFNFLKTHQNDCVLFSSSDALSFLKSIDSLRILEGALCSSTEVVTNWIVYYKQEQLSFKGKIFIALPIKAINWKIKKFSNLKRDVVIADLEEMTSKINELLPD